MKKTLTGYIYSEEKLKWENLDYKGQVQGTCITLLKNKKDARNFNVKKVRLTLEEL